MLGCSCSFFVRRGPIRRAAALAVVAAVVASPRAANAGNEDELFVGNQAAMVVSGRGDFYGATAGLELSNEHLLAPTETVQSLVFSSVFAIRYAYSDGSFGRTVVDPSQLGSGEAISDDNGAFVARKGSLFVHEIGLYVGSGLRF